MALMNSNSSIKYKSTEWFCNAQWFFVLKEVNLCSGLAANGQIMALLPWLLLTLVAFDLLVLPQTHSLQTDQGLKIR